MQIYDGQMYNSLKRPYSYIIHITAITNYVSEFYTRSLKFETVLVFLLLCRI